MPSLSRLSHLLICGAILLLGKMSVSVADNADNEVRGSRYRSSDYEAEPIAIDADSVQDPPERPSRRLPIKFKSVDPAKDGSRNIRASAVEEEPAPLQPKPKTREAKPRLLSPPSATETTQRSHPELPRITTLVGSLAVVVGLFLIVAWGLRRGMPKQAAWLPKEALEVLGRQRIAGKQEVHLVRLGNKILLLNIHPGSAETLTEITDPLEVDRLTGLCYQAQPKSATKGFQQVFQQFAQERPSAQKAKPAARPAFDKLDVPLFSKPGRSAANRVEIDA